MRIICRVCAGLGPNGAIVTSLNLFATKFDQVLKLVDARSREHEYVVMML